MDNNNKQRNNNPMGDGSNSPRRQNLILLLVAALITMLLMTYFLRAFSENTSKEITYSKFIEYAEGGYVDHIVIESDRINITMKTVDEIKKLNKEQGKPANYALEETDGEELADEGYGRLSIWSIGNMKNTRYTGIAEEYTELTNRMLKLGVTVSSEVPDSSGVILNFILLYIAPILIMWFLLSMIFRKMGKGGGPLSVGKSNAKVYVQKETGVTFKDVAGEDEAKESLVEVVDFLHNPAKYAKIGAKLPKGALLVGPPGTGKTLLAKAVAGEAHVPFYSLAGSDFIELYVGVGASRVRDLFSEASKNAPCIIFIDEIDAIGRSRDNKYGGGNEEREQTLNQLLSEMDGFDSSKGVLILGATNRPEILDKALLRPGRFDRRIVVDKPDLKGREDILKVHSKDVKMDETVDLKEVALATGGAVGSDLANMINEAAINAVKAGREYVCQQDLMEAFEQVIAGKEKKNSILSKEERKLVSYHEVGHALVSAVLTNTEPVQKITIVPRTMGSLGYVLHVPDDEKNLNTKEELLQEIKVLLGGRAAEEIIFNTVTTGASNDIEKATSIARAMITQYGMSDRFGLMQLESIQNRYLDGNRILECSDETATLIDEEVKKLLAECYEESKKVVSAHLDTMDKIAAFLIEKETITGKEFMKIYREAEGLTEPTEEEVEAAKKKRIYATRAESALVGANIPDKRERKEEEEKKEEPGQDDQSKPSSEAPFEDSTGIDYNEGIFANENSSQSQAQSGGRFSHAPEDFDK
ncbi:ATP-dependent zinc metalloprotease FtsH [Butyrivibrio sp. MC2021]|uniref:ATP-dependent zinc metalloprotease FtsH n=1 Tax=Butyrivibrio sp. MC2021 TaxID=1408306 RepID=UPI0005632E75|nr:ATP-dependent zinc metalloprotease FtsH [Butyrivibrio sp. MC2021]